MAISKDKFYEADRKEYILRENEEFLLWFYANIKEGYFPALSIKEMEKLIRTLVMWYELKYPINSISSIGDVEHVNFVNDYMSDSMTIFALKYRLTPRERSFFDCVFRMGSSHNYENGTITFSIKDKESNTSHKITIDDKTGIVKNGDLGFLEIFENVTDSLTILEIYRTLKDNKRFDITELKRVHLHHKTDIRLRRRIFELVNLALIYSRNTTPEVGYKRAKMFSKEFSRYFHLDIEPPELESFPLTKTSKKLKETVKTIHLISKIDAEMTKYYK